MVAHGTSTSNIRSDMARSNNGSFGSATFVPDVVDDAPAPAPPKLLFLFVVDVDDDDDEGGEFIFSSAPPSYSVRANAARHACRTRGSACRMRATMAPVVDDDDDGAAAVTAASRSGSSANPVGR